MTPSVEIAALAGAFEAQSVGERLSSIVNAVSGRIVFTTSFGIEDQVITHWISETRLPIELVTLDTGRLFSETYALWAETERRYGVSIEAWFPDPSALRGLMREQGVNGFYDSIERRRACCNIRKIEPLSRALNGAAGWVTGLRGDASAGRAGMQRVEFDAAHNLVKFNPLFDWSRQQVADFAARENVPVNPLHEKGFASIGCAPCTRALAPGEPERAGRWWWEHDSQKECGLHVDANGRLVRAAPARQSGLPE